MAFIILLVWNVENPEKQFYLNNARLGSCRTLTFFHVPRGAGYFYTSLEAIMEWFKHKTASHDDPDISDCEDIYGDAGYSIFFKLLEVYGQEFNHLDDGWLDVSQTFVRRKLRKTWTKVEQVLNFYQGKNRLCYTAEHGRLKYKVPNFIDIASNWTKRKPEAPTEVPTEAPTAIELELELELDKDKKKDKEKTWRTDFSIYQEIEHEEYNSLIDDTKFLQLLITMLPGVDITATLEKSHREFWSQEDGWKNKKSKRSKKIDWKGTYRNACKMEFNQVKKVTNNLQPGIDVKKLQERMNYEQ